MKPLAQVRYPVMMRLRKDTIQKLHDLAFEQGLKTGPFSVHVMESICQCPPSKFHAAIAAFLEESRRR
jgi:hypothetical protein